MSIAWASNCTAVAADAFTQGAVGAGAIVGEGLLAPWANMPHAFIITFATSPTRPLLRDLSYVEEESPGVPEDGEAPPQGD
ncbi:hypothetical protein V500_10267 [Pseudogymnoascus sp. VKM F-4518 (FW-2643)]|nr:hypothetical protein V500_10267 [Pseudogymnoascus sp. VKM F-4518 (FW-2643)]